MDQLLSSVTVLMIVLCGLGIMTSAVFGKKADAFLFLRPIFRFGRRQLAKAITGLYAFFKRITRSALNTARNNRRSALTRIACGLVLPLCATAVIALWLPAEIIGSKK